MPCDPARWPPCVRCGLSYAQARRWPEGRICAYSYDAARQRQGSCAGCGLGGLGERFAEYRDALGLPGELGLHCLRHSYVTHLIEAGYDPLFVQQQVGHSYASTTALYTSVSADYRARTLRRVLDATVGAALGPAPTTSGAS